MDIPRSPAKDRDLTKYCNGVLYDPNKTHATDSRLFNDNNRPYLLTLLLSALLVYYMIPIVYIFLNREKPAIKTRSPLMIVLTTGFLLIDSVLNTIIYSIDQFTYSQLICDLGILATAVPFTGAMLFYLVRMYRMYRFFSLY